VLRALRLRNLAVIEEISVPFAPGLNVLSGETGAGKSIVIDALLMVTGARAQPELIRSGADTALVEARFEVDADGPAGAVLEAAGHRVEDGQVIVRRELSRAGRNRVFVNDAAATVGLLERLGEALVELHGQHEHQRLLQPARQRELLDDFADLRPLVAEVGERVRRWAEAREALRRLETEAREQARQEDLHRFQLAEIDAVAPREDEEEALRAERRRLAGAERIATALREAVACLYDDPQAAAARLSRARGLLQELVAVDPEVAAPLEDLDAALAHVEEAVARTRVLRDRAAADPGRLEEIDARLDALVKLKRKYGETLASVLAYRDEVAAALERLERHDELATAHRAQLARRAAEAGEAGARLSAGRAAAAARLERQVERALRGLGMERARFRIGLERQPAGADELASGPEGWRLGPQGAETVEYLLSANPGEPPRPLAKAVSGGELSRTMLALRTILAAADRVPVLVFDEVDAGIGGRVADQVAAALAAAAAGRQVLCVTHLAAIAARADHHLVVDKQVGRASTRTSVRPVAGEDRVAELARMLGGERVTEAARRHARELLRGPR
jgi:DNA repair protein RecN (Recombination protein N)